jgi:hypothetical protein
MWCRRASVDRSARIGKLDPTWNCSSNRLCASSVRFVPPWWDRRLSYYNYQLIITANSHSFPKSSPPEKPPSQRPAPPDPQAQLAPDRARAGPPGRAATQPRPARPTGGPTSASPRPGSDAGGGPARLPADPQESQSWSPPRIDHGVFFASTRETRFAIVLL